MKISKLKSENKIGLVLVLLLIVFAVTSRLAPHPANFAPVAAVAMFGGAILPRRLAMTLPLGVMVISDLIIGLHPLIMFTWGSFAVIALVSSFKFKKLNVKNLALGSVLSSILFYVVTNFGVWAEGRLYDRTFAGLMQSYYNAMPFFRNTLLGDIVYAGVLFGAYALAVSLVKNKGTLATKNIKISI